MAQDIKDMYWTFGGEYVKTIGAKWVLGDPMEIPTKCGRKLEIHLFQNGTITGLVSMSLMD